MEASVYTCIVCPRGCRITVGPDGSGGFSVEGNACGRGRAYAISEHSHPERTLTTTIAVEGSRLRRLAVHSERPLPRELLRTALAQVMAMRVEAPVRMGDVVLADVCGTGVDVLASRDAPALR